YPVQQSRITFLNPVDVDNHIIRPADTAIIPIPMRIDRTVGRVNIAYPDIVKSPRPGGSPVTYICHHVQFFYHGLPIQFGIGSIYRQDGISLPLPENGFGYLSRWYGIQSIITAQESE